MQRELSRLEAGGLVTVSRIGNQKHFQANSAAPIFGELRAVIRETSGLADVLRSALAPLSASVHAAFVYGSLAKHADSVISDVDLMIISDTLAYSDLYAALDDAGRRLNRTANPTTYTRSKSARRIERHNGLITKVLAQPKVWLVGEDDDIATCLQAPGHAAREPGALLSTSSSCDGEALGTGQASRFRVVPSSSARGRYWWRHCIRSSRQRCCPLSPHRPTRSPCRT